MVDEDKKQSDFESLATEKQQGIVAEFMSFIKENQNWWLFPIILVLLGIAALVILGGTAVAPFIYTLF